MIQSRFRLELDFEVKSKNSSFLGGLLGNDHLINEFVNAFVKHGEAMKGYFTQDLFEVWVTDENKNLVQLLGSNIDDGLFLEVADHCSDETKQFIYELFDHTRPPTVQRSNEEKEALINKIYKNLGHLRIVNAQFNQVNPENGREQKEKTTGKPSAT